MHSNMTTILFFMSFEVVIILPTSLSEICMWVTFLHCLFVFLGPVGPHRQGHKTSSVTEEAEEMNHCDIFLLLKVISRKSGE